MKTEVESISPVKKRLSIEVPAEDLAKEEDAAFRELRRSVNIPGFRKGKAPLSVLKNRFGDQIRSDAIGRVIQRSYLETLQEESIAPVADADIQVQSTAEDDHVAYTAVVEIRPEVEPTGYTELDLKRERVSVEEIEVEARLESLRAEHGTYEPAGDDHVAAMGDMLVMDYEGTIDGIPFDGGSGSDRPLQLGSGMLVPGFEEGLVGAVAGEERILDLTFPEDYRSEELAGKSTQFKVQVKEIKLRQLPELDDDFAKQTADAEGLEELRDRIRESIQVEKKSTAERKFRDQVADRLLEANPFEVPESMIQRQQAHSLERVRTELAQRGHDPEALGINEPGVQESHRRGAERAVRWAFLLRAIAHREGLEISDEDVDARIEAIAEADGRPSSLIRSFFDEEEQMDALRSSLQERKVTDWVVEHSTVTEVEPEDLAGEGVSDE